MAFRSFPVAVVVAASLCVGFALALLPSSTTASVVAYSPVAPAAATTRVALSSGVLRGRPLPVVNSNVPNAAMGEPAGEGRRWLDSVAANPLAPASVLAWIGAALMVAASLLVASERPQDLHPLGCAPPQPSELQPLCGGPWAAAAATGSSAPIYVINGFFVAMREKYTREGAAIRYFLAEWDPAAVSWKHFRGQVLGATDPAIAAEGSIRRSVLQTYRALGLATEPNVGDNAVHASASPFEALVERMNWMGVRLEEDDFGRALLGAGVPRESILAWTKDPQVQFEGETRGLFDIMEDTDVQECLHRAQAVAGVSGPISFTKNQAFVFVKPHAMVPKAIEFVKEKLVAAGITLGQSGELDNKTIESQMLIDNHYYAIANRASLSKPQNHVISAACQLEFEKLFGERWTDVLAAGRVFNALDASKELGIAGTELDSFWGVAKKAGKLVKFGGGFYVGQLSF